MRVLFRNQNKNSFSDAYFAVYRYLREQPKWREKNSETVSNGINEKDSNSLSAATTTAAAAASKSKRSALLAEMPPRWKKM